MLIEMKVYFAVKKMLKNWDGSKMASVNHSVTGWFDCLTSDVNVWC